MTIGIHALQQTTLTEHLRPEGKLIVQCTADDPGHINVGRRRHFTAVRPVSATPVESCADGDRHVYNRYYQIARDRGTRWRMLSVSRDRCLAGAGHCAGQEGQRSYKATSALSQRCGLWGNGLPATRPFHDGRWSVMLSQAP